MRVRPRAVTALDLRQDANLMYAGCAFRFAPVAGAQHVSLFLAPRQALYKTCLVFCLIVFYVIFAYICVLKQKIRVLLRAVGAKRYKEDVDLNYSEVRFHLIGEVPLFERV